MEQLTSEIHALFDAFKNESNIFVEKGNKAAAARARKISLT